MEKSVFEVSLGFYQSVPNCELYTLIISYAGAVIIKYEFDTSDTNWIKKD